MRLSGAASCLLALGILLSGCTSTPPASADEVEQGLEELDLKASDTTGVIRGVVVDESITPIAEVLLSVRVGDINRTTNSTQDGLFGMDGLAPGEYFIQASKAGYKSTQSAVTVVAGVDNPPPTKIQLTVDVSSLPYFEERQYDAFIGCSVTSPTVSAAACDIVGPVKEATNNEFLVNYEASAPPSWIQSEAIWDSSQPAGDDLSLSLTDFSSGPQKTVAQAAGKSPIYFTVNETLAREYNYGINNTMTIRLFSTTVEGTDNVDESTFQDPYRDSVYDPLNSTGAPGVVQGVVDIENACCGLTNNPIGNPECIEDAVLFDTCFDVGGVGIVVNQKVTVFTHIFYGYTPPEGWRFSESNNVPLPP